MNYRHRSRLVAVSSLLLSLASTSCSKSAIKSEEVPDDVYVTYGVHNSAHADSCENSQCIYPRKPGEPSDPQWPEYWTSNWTMYRVHENSEDHLPPYDGKPPSPLVEGQDYEASSGTTYYDSTWKDSQGAIMEHYEKRCLPIFPIDNKFTCSFISLGDNAFFVTYDEDRPDGMPPVCLFSSRNHPPKRDFIKHLPYSQIDSDRLGGSVQSYSFWVSPDGKFQVGVSPAQTANKGTMFGYAFYSQETPDRVDTTAAPYRHPHSFFFSGETCNPPDAPIISQNYTNFAMVRPDPAKTWDKVSKLDPRKLPKCELFNPPAPSCESSHSWHSIGRKR